MNAPKKAEKSEPDPVRYEQAADSTTTPVPPLANATRPLGDADGNGPDGEPIPAAVEPAVGPATPDLPPPTVASVEEPVEVEPVAAPGPAVMDSSRIKQPIGLKAERAAARAAAS